MTGNKIDFIAEDRDMKRLQRIEDETGHSRSKLMRVALKLMLAEAEGTKYEMPGWFQNITKILTANSNGNDWLEDAKEEEK